MVCEPLDVDAGNNLGPLKEQYMCLTIEPFLPLLYSTLLTK